jgi:hypothetical protein
MTFLYTANHNAATVGPTTTVVGSAQNVFAAGEQGIFMRDTGGQLHVWAISNGSTLTADLALSFANGSAAVIGVNDSVVNAGQNLLQQGGHDVRVQTAAGQIQTWEFNNNGVVLATGLFNAGNLIG